MSENKNDFGFYGNDTTGYAHYTQAVKSTNDLKTPRKIVVEEPELPDEGWGFGVNSKHHYEDNRTPVSPMFWLIVIPILLLAFINDMM